MCSVTKDDFTSNEFLSPPYVRIEDETMEIVGYVIKTANNRSSANSRKYHKVIISNAVGKEVQVIAWQEHTDKISHLQLGQICLISALKVIKGKQNYNGGNVDFELLVKQNTAVETFGYFKNEEVNVKVLEEVSIREVYNLLEKTIKVRGIIRTLPRAHKNLEYDCIVGAITDCDYKLEFKLGFDKLTLPLKMGQSVMMIGTMSKITNGPPTLLITNEDNIQILDTPIVTFGEIMKGFRSVNNSV